MIWIILICLNCDVEAARAAGWSADAVLSQPVSLFSWRREDAREFASRRQCLRALRRENPETDLEPAGDGELAKTTHMPDYVERFESLPLRMNAATNLGCFAEAQPTS